MTPELCGCMPIVPMLPGVTNVKFCPTHAAAFETKEKLRDLDTEVDDLRYWHERYKKQNAALLAALERMANDHPLILESDDGTEVAGWFVSVARGAIAQAKGESQERLDSTTRLGKAMVDATRLERNEAKRWDQ